MISVLSAINRANLKPAHKLSAFALLELAPNGAVALTWDAVFVATGLTTKGAVRKLIAALRGAGLVKCDTGEWVWLEFLDTKRANLERLRAEMERDEDGAGQSLIAGDAETERERANLERLRANLERLRAEMERLRAKNDAPTNWLVGIDTITPSGEYITNQPEPEPEPSASNTEIARRIALLTDPEVGVSEQKAADLAVIPANTFDLLLRQIFAWRSDVKAGRVKDSGALVHRIVRGFRSGDLTDRDRTTDLYRRHVSEDEDRARVAAVYVPDEYAAIINT